MNCFISFHCFFVVQIIPINIPSPFACKLNDTKSLGGIWGTSPAGIYVFRVIKNALSEKLSGGQSSDHFTV